MSEPDCWVACDDAKIAAKTGASLGICGEEAEEYQIED